MLAMSQTNGGAPVWITVLCARAIGGFAVGFLSYSALVAAEPAVASATWNDALTFVPRLIGALVTGLAITLLLPAMSARRIALGNAILAAFAGGMIPLIAGLVVVGGVVRASSGSMVAVAGTGIALALVTQILGLGVTAWMVSSSSTERERRRDQPADARPTWSSIEEIDREGATVDEERAERGSWGWVND